MMARHSFEFLHAAVRDQAEGNRYSVRQGAAGRAARGPKTALAGRTWVDRWVRRARSPAAGRRGRLADCRVEARPIMAAAAARRGSRGRAGPAMCRPEALPQNGGPRAGRPARGCPRPQASLGLSSAAVLRTETAQRYVARYRLFSAGRARPSFVVVGRFDSAAIRVRPSAPPDSGQGSPPVSPLGQAPRKNRGSGGTKDARGRSRIAGEATGRRRAARWLASHRPAATPGRPRFDLHRDQEDTRRCGRATTSAGGAQRRSGIFVKLPSGPAGLPACSTGCRRLRRGLGAPPANRRQAAASISPAIRRRRSSQNARRRGRGRIRARPGRAW